jgi:hypothetical protein
VIVPAIDQETAHPTLAHLGKSDLPRTGRHAHDAADVTNREAAKGLGLGPPMRTVGLQFR